MENKKIFDKSFLEGIASNPQSFVSEFEKTSGYILYRCQQEGVMVPIETIREIPLYDTYPVCLEEIKKSPDVNEIILFDLIENTLDTSMWFSEDALKSIKKKLFGNMSGWKKIIKSAGFNRLLNKDELINIEEIIYEDIYNELKNGTKESHWLKFLKDSMNQMSKAELEQLDTRLASFPFFEEVFTQKEVDFRSVPGIGMRSPIGYFYEDGFLNDGEKVASSFRKFKSNFILKEIPNEMWESSQKSNEFLSQFGKVFDLDTESYIIENFKDNKVFMHSIFNSQPNDVFMSIRGKNLLCSEVIDNFAKDNYSLSRVFKEIEIDRLKELANSANPLFSALVKIKLNINLNNDIGNYALDSREISAVSKSTHILNFLSNHNSTIKTMIQDALGSGDSSLIKGWENIWSKCLKDGEYGLDIKARTTNNLNFFVNAISLMPTSINKLTISRSLLLNLKNESVKFPDYKNGDVNIERLKDLMVAPEELKVPLNKYSKRGGDSDEYLLSVDELNLLLNFGDPEYNNIISIPKLALLGNSNFVNSNEFKRSNDEKILSFNEIIEMNKFGYDKNGDIIDNNDVFSSHVADFLNNNIEVDKDDLLTVFSKSLMTVLKQASLLNTLTTDMDSFHVNIFDDVVTLDKLSPEAREKQEKFNVEVKNLSFCLAILDMRKEVYSPEGNASLINYFFKKVDIKDFNQDVIYKLAYIVKHLDKTNLLEYNQVKGGLKDNILYSVFSSHELRDEMYSLEDCVKTLSHQSSVTAIESTKYMWGENEFNSALKEHNPALLAALGKNLSYDEIKDLWSWDTLYKFINGETKKDNNLFISCDDKSPISIQNIDLLTDIIRANLRNNDDYKEFIKICDLLKNENKVGYVVLLSKLNTQEVCESSKSAQDDNVSSNNLFNQCFDVDAYSEGLWSLFQEKAKYNNKNNKELNNELTLNSFYLTHSLASMTILPQAHKEELSDKLMNKANDSMYEKIAVPCFNYYLNEGYNLSNIQILDSFIAEQNSFSNRAKISTLNITNMLNASFNKKEEDDNKKLFELFDIVDYCSLLLNIKNNSVFPKINKSSIDLIKKLDKSTNVIALVEAMRGEISISKELNKHPLDKNDAYEADAGSFYKL